MAKQNTSSRAQCINACSLGFVPDNDLPIQDALVVLQLLLDHSIHDGEVGVLPMVYPASAVVLNVIAVAVQLDTVP